MNCEDNEGDNIEVNDVVQDDSILRQAHGDYANCEGVHDLFPEGDYCLFYGLEFPAGRQNEDVCAFGHRFGLQGKLLQGRVRQPSTAQEQALWIRYVSDDVLHDESELEEQDNNVALAGAGEKYQSDGFPWAKEYVRLHPSQNFEH